MRKLLMIAACIAVLAGCNKKPDETTTTNADLPKPLAQSEFADSKYSQMAKASLTALSTGDIDAMANTYADNIVYTWSSLDSLSGKQAVTDYWRERRTKVIDSLSYSNEIWLSLKVNQPQARESAGNYALAWNAVNAKYKNGKKLVFLVHTVFHFNSADKIDRVYQYIDRGPINAALAAKK